MFTRGCAVLIAVALLAACERNDPTQRTGPDAQAPQGASAGTGTGRDPGPSLPNPADRPSGAPPTPRPTDLASPSNPREDRSETRQNPPGQRPDPAPQPGAPATAADTLNNYLEDLAEATRLLRASKDSTSAGTNAARLDQLADRINAATTRLEALPDAEKTQLRGDTRLASATAEYRAEADRITNDSSFGAAIRDPVQRIRLFE